MAHTHRTLHAFDVRSLLLFASLTLGGTSSLMAQPAPGAVLGPVDAGSSAAPQNAEQQNAQNIFQRADVDGDGFLSREEAKALPAVLEQFELWDHDGDGKISLQEFLSAARARSNQ